MPELALGTAQFGLDYGITNQSGQVPEREVSLILEQAAAAGIRYLDTAQAYGNSETILGKTLPKKHSFRIVSKLPKQNSEPFSGESQKKWERDFQFSLQKMGVNAVEGFLLHNPADIKRDDAYYLLDWLLTLKQRGLVNHLGLSIYEASDLDGISLDWVQLVQLPLSLYDQRLIHDGTIEFLSDIGIRIQARSIFLQGLLLSNVEKWPTWIDKSLREHHTNLVKFAREGGLSLLELALAYVVEQSFLESIVVGLTSINELQSLVSSFQKLQKLKVFSTSNTLDWSLDKTEFLDPRKWGK
jgi:aryl-alcohol dehydrogenase-like predicted oxidoreductase